MSKPTSIADQKEPTVNLSNSHETSTIMNPFMNIVNKPRVKTIAGNVNITKIGFIAAFNSPKISAAINRLTKLSPYEISPIRAASHKAPAFTRRRKINVSSCRSISINYSSLAPVLVTKISSSIRTPMPSSGIYMPGSTVKTIFSASGCV